MDGLQVSITCLLLKMTFEPCSAVLLQNPSRCPTCPQGYFVMQNCSVSPDGGVGVRCKLCTDCSAVRQDTVVECSTFADSVCGNQTTAAVTPTETLAEAPADLSLCSWSSCSVCVSACCPAQTSKVPNTKVWICCDGSGSVFET